jgi:hypothetical protein
MSVGAGLLALLLSSNIPGESLSVGRDQILEAMMQTQGFDPTATTNGPRFQAEVVLRLARDARAHDPEARPLFIGHAEWFSAFLARTRLVAERAPSFIRLAYEHAQDMEIDYRWDRVVRAVEGPRPDLAANVAIWWPRTREGPEAYSYEDLLSTPRLKVTNRRVITYRLLHFGDMLVFGEIEGLLGRPTTGVLGFLFRIIGEGHVAENRMTISADGLQIARARSCKAFIEVTTTVTVYPDGRTEKDLPLSRPDLAALEARLKQPLRLSYRPLGPPPGQ